MVFCLLRERAWGLFALYHNFSDDGSLRLNDNVTNDDDSSSFLSNAITAQLAL